MKLYLLLGYPVEHSKTPALMNGWIKKYGIDANYGLWSIQEGSFSKDLLMKRGGVAGFNITYPYKLSFRKKPVNIAWKEKSRWRFDCLDGKAFCDDIEAIGHKKSRIRIIGMGATGTAIYEEGKRRRLDIEPAFFDDKIDVLVNATGRGMRPNSLRIGPYEFHHIKTKFLAYDLTYLRKTEFLVEAEKRGHKIRDGLAMMKRNAELSFERFFGIKP